MSHNLGPAMLEHLEAKRATMSEGEYLSRRMEIEQLIRSGKAIEHTALERVWRVALIPIGLVLWFALALAGKGGAVLGLVAFVGCIVASRLVGRRL